MPEEYKHFSKTKPMKLEHFADCIKWWNDRCDIQDEDTDTYKAKVSKGEQPLCHITYNDTGYTKHCIDYKNYKTWERERNPIRYESNLNKNYDSKNIMHCIRMIHMATEIANGDGIILDRRVAGDRDFLMKISNHEFEYDEIMDYVESAKEKMNTAMKSSTIRDKVDSNMVDDLLINVRKKQLCI